MKSEEELTKEELELVTKLIEACEKHNLYVTEEELFKVLNK